MKFSKNQTRARPSQGGSFLPPVVPTNPELWGWSAPTTPADDHAFRDRRYPREAACELRHEPGVDWSDVARGPCGICGKPAAFTYYDVPLCSFECHDGAKPAVDAELESERARLVGKRVRWSKHATGAAVIGKQVTSEEVQGVERRDGVVVALFLGNGWFPSVEVEPIPDAPLMLGDLKPGERFKFTDQNDHRERIRKERGYRIDGQTWIDSSAYDGFTVERA